MEDFQINEYLPLRDVVFETLRQKILKGELKPGERLIEVALAQRLGVSRTPVREAIHKLEQEGLVVMAPRKGAQVATISAQSVRDVLEVRKAMECLAVCLAISRILVFGCPVRILCCSLLICFISSNSKSVYSISSFHFE